MPPSAAAVYFMQDILQVVARLSGSGSGHGGGSGDQQGPCHKGDSHQVHDYHHEGGGVGNLDSVVCNGSTHIQIVVNMGSSGGGSGNFFFCHNLQLGHCLRSLALPRFLANSFRLGPHF